MRPVPRDRFALVGLSQSTIPNFQSGGKDGILYLEVMGMSAQSSVSSKGQVTIPVTVRKSLGLRTGDLVEFVAEGGRTVLRPVRGEENPFAKWVGAAKGFKSLDDINGWVM